MYRGRPRPRDASQLCAQVLLNNALADAIAAGVTLSRSRNVVIYAARIYASDTVRSRRALPEIAPFIREAFPIIRLGATDRVDDPRFNIYLTLIAPHATDISIFAHRNKRNSLVKRVCAHSLALARILFVMQPGAFAQTHRAVRRVT